MQLIATDKLFRLSLEQRPLQDALEAINSALQQQKQARLKLAAELQAKIGMGAQLAAVIRQSLKQVIQQSSQRQIAQEGQLKSLKEQMQLMTIASRQHQAVILDLASHKKASGRVNELQGKRIEQANMAISDLKDELAMLRSSISNKPDRVQVQRIKKQQVSQTNKMAMAREALFLLQEQTDFLLRETNKQAHSRKEQSSRKVDNPAPATPSRPQSSQLVRDSRRLMTDSIYDKVDQLDIKVQKIIELQKQREEQFRGYSFSNSKEVELEGLRIRYEEQLYRFADQVQMLENRRLRASQAFEEDRHNLLKDVSQIVKEAFSQIDRKLREVSTDSSNKLQNLAVKVDLKLDQKEFTQQGVIQRSFNQTFQSKLKDRPLRKEVKAAVAYLEGKLKQLITVVTSQQQVEKEGLAVRRVIKCLSCDKNINSTMYSGPKDSFLNDPGSFISDIKPQFQTSKVRKQKLASLDRRSGWRAN